uniref:ThiD2 domain-containing protein n=1 Tax=Caenorhabditis tropicalis TaxID=1561998 RepID=A0A1I7TBL9_9PELO
MSTRQALVRDLFDITNAPLLRRFYTLMTKLREYVKRIDSMREFHRHCVSTGQVALEILNRRELRNARQGLRNKIRAVNRMIQRIRVQISDETEDEPGEVNRIEMETVHGFNLALNAILDRGDQTIRRILMGDCSRQTRRQVEQLRRWCRYCYKEMKNFLRRVARFLEGIDVDAGPEAGSGRAVAQ